ncbi:4-aminobutyrate--2-oxoglutarate transaminase [Asticcacaulis taihuensis]|uniref:4-aminobutyrate aminotransferase / (S)-3-amino-2-methylpropionate transaminase n=1 Tax=Asticcacaulis taihuensis TaxID=260084 RepID=A0A1G4RFZ2_9CAUL|nr:4-aminobutyrate--2-oxoglutarate transaminase [Asticcacaulis taihuensis]SCW55690.1 4-aminobutyrate aminotransferase / (S)-3-amino-2-methylpropionate transaminase [Asticcacaulis taihuensis]
MSHNADLAARRATAVARGIGHATTLYAGRAENAELWDADGNRFIDFAGGIAVLNTGHRHPKVQAAALKQMDAFTHTAFQVVPYESYIALAEKINALAPIDGPAKCAFFTTGSEAVENAVKIARCHTKRDGVIAFTGGFHGRTALTSALTGKVVPYKKDLGPQQPGIYHLPFPVEAHGIDTDDTLKMLDYLFKADIAPDAVAAIIIEPVQGEGGFLITPPELMRALRKKCDEHGILLIADEVQTGFGRTGKLFAMENYDVKPDLMTMAKSLAGGYPLSGVVGRAEVMDAPIVGGLGGTYGGNPVACAAALAVLEVIEEEKLLDAANRQGAKLKARLEALAQRNDIVPITAIRGLGAMIAFDIVTERGSFTPDAATTKAVTTKAQANGLILLSCGVYANTIRLLAPLTASDEILDEGLAKLEAALTI